MQISWIARHRPVQALAAALCAAVVAACGGGGDSGSGTTGSSGTASGSVDRVTAYAAGPISGFGSIIVNGVRYDDSGAEVTDDEGRARGRDMLRLGMMVEVDGTAVSSSASTGRALRVRFGSELVGPVSAVGASSLTVLGQTVNVTSTTVFDDTLTGGLAAIAVSDVLEVHALYDAATASYTAVRIEDAALATTYKLRGLVADLDTAAKTFTLGGQVVDYASVAATELPAGLANGLRIHVRLQTTQVNGRWVATALRSGVRRVDDGLGAHLRGSITAFTSTSAFSVNGIPVDASGASFPDGSTGIVLGAVVEVHGTASNGTLVATKVELDSRHAGERHRFELHGTISALDTTARTFKLRNLTVSYGDTVTWKDGTAANLVDGAKVEVKGALSADRTTLTATVIAFE